MLINAGVKGFCRGAEGNKLLLILTGFLLSPAGLVFIALNLGQPSRILFLLSHITAPFSLMVLSQAIVTILCLLSVFMAKNRFNQKVLALLCLLGGLFYALAAGRFYMIFTRPALNHYIVVLLILIFICATASHISFCQDKRCKLLKLFLMSLFAICFSVFVIRIGYLGNADKLLQIQSLFSGAVSGIFCIIIAAFAIALISDYLMIKRAEKLFHFLALSCCFVAGAGVIYLFNITENIVKTMY